MKHSLLILFAIILLPSAVMAQENQPTDMDWARFAYYDKLNKKVDKKPLAILYGDSITRGWVRSDASWLEERNFLGRGIGGQTTMQLLVRFRADVIELEPEYVVILAGINDIARNNGYITMTNTFKNLLSMVDLAKYHGIKPIMCTILPADEIGWRKRVGDPRPQIDSLNTMIMNYAKENDIPLVDYHTAMKDENGGMISEYRTDAVHPNFEGYKVMEDVLADVFHKIHYQKKQRYSRRK
ncbi:MAG: acylhydrolase [Bacteroidales bacterium]|nr:acylhydrolase [Bacteroidales bacterium]